jgi:UDP-N-acetylglucosamine 2-epimerase (non-hydrolysing)
MKAFEPVLLEIRPDMVIVVGDVNSTMACSITAKKLHIKVAHIEAGLRSFDMTMPEEINRLVTDSICDYYYTTSPHANANLRNAGVDDEKVVFVGNTMIDTLIKQRSKFKKPKIYDNLGLIQGNYIIMTLHRPSNVDEELKLKSTISEILANSAGLPVVFPIHPRTKKVIDKFKISDKNLHIVNPMGYLEFNYLVERSKLVITDSGGVTEETTVMNIPCITLRDTTERPETVSIGTNELIGTNPNNIAPIMTKLFRGEWKEGDIPKLWDGKTSQRIVETLSELNAEN